jgi:hypothetical protein
VAEEDLRLMIVHDARVHAGHALVTARLDGRWLVLDNRRLSLAEDRDLPRFVPLFSLGQSGVSRLAMARPQEGDVPQITADAAQGVDGSMK